MYSRIFVHFLRRWWYHESQWFRNFCNMESDQLPMLLVAIRNLQPIWDPLDILEQWRVVNSHQYKAWWELTNPLSKFNNGSLHENGDRNHHRPVNLWLSDWGKWRFNTFRQPSIRWSYYHTKEIVATHFQFNLRKRDWKELLLVDDIRKTRQKKLHEKSRQPWHSRVLQHLLHLEPMLPLPRKTQTYLWSDQKAASLPR